MTNNLVSIVKKDPKTELMVDIGREYDSITRIAVLEAGLSLTEAAVLLANRLGETVRTAATRGEGDLEDLVPLVLDVLKKQLYKKDLA